MKKVEDFKKVIMRSSLMGKEEMDLMNKIPNEYFSDIFERNFNSNLSLAKRIMMNDYDEVERVDGTRLDREKKQIRNFHSSVKTMLEYSESGKKILFVTDNDNDGSLSQAAILEFQKIVSDNVNKNIEIVYAQTIGGNSARGLTKELIDAYSKKLGLNNDSDFLIITADNGINSRDEQVKIQKSYPNTKLLITDHHLPDSEECVLENSKTIIFNPKYKPTKYFKTRNISGANTLEILLQEFAKESYISESKNALTEDDFKSEYSEQIKNLREISKIANLLDYVDTDIADKPIKHYTIEKFSKLGTLLNVNNSLSKIITGEITKSLLDTISKNIPDLNIENLKDQFNLIKVQNAQAKILLDIIKENTLNGKVISGSGSPENLILKKMGQDLPPEEINNNYIEQLRPHIYNFSAIDNKDAFVDELNDYMISCFQQISSAEKEILKELRKGSILNINKNENSTILTPKDSAITRIFNRKLIGKAYNEENNGFILTLDNIKDTEMTGSFRAMHRVQDILKNSADFEKENGVRLTFMGHDKAAGFFIKSRNGKKLADPDLIIKNLNVFINDRIIELKEFEVNNELPPILVDLDSTSIIDKINMAIRGNVTNMKHISPIIKFNKSTYLNDSRTTEQKSLQEFVSEKKYGYTSVNINFAGDTIIIPTELLRSVVKSNFKDALKLSYIDEGVMIASNIVESENLKRVTDLRVGNEGEQRLTDYYSERFLKDGNHQVNLTYENIKELSYFKNNVFGEKEFSRFENYIIDILNKTDADILAVFDTEGTGLGKAPKLFNLGSLNVEIDKEKFERESKAEFFGKLFTTIDGSDFLLGDDDQSDLMEVDDSKISKLPFSARKLLIKHMESGKSYIHNPSTIEELNSFNRVSNYKVVGDDVIFNQKIKFDMISYLINDTDFKITPQIEKLTAISNKMLNKVGRRTADVDEEFTKKFEGKKVIFQAHNLPYDLGIIGSNMPKLYNLMNKSLLSDSAGFSRNFKLAYDKVDMGHIDLPFIKPHYFYSSDVSDFSFEKFLMKGENGIFPDRTGNYVARIKDSVLSLIDKTEGKEVEIGGLDVALAAYSRREMPNNSIKYSVQELSTHENIRNLLLSKDDFKINLIAIPSKFKAIESELNFLMDNYHFDSSYADNINNFTNYLASRDLSSKVTSNFDRSDLEGFLSDFISKNKETQAKFHDSWIYKSVLKLHNPVGKVTNDMVDLISYKTDLPKEKVSQVLNDALDYKNKFNLDNVILDEVHNNIIYDEKGLGDVILELALTLKRMGDRNFDSFSKSINYASEHFILNMSDTMRKHITRDLKSKKSDIDSNSALQSRAYTRRVKTDFILQASGEYKDSIKLKLPIGILPTGSSIFAKLKDGVVLNNEQVDDISSKLGEIVKVEQLKNSVLYMKMPEDLKETAIDSLSMNDELSATHKKEMLELFEFVYFDRRDDVMKKVSESISEIVSGSTAPSKAIAYNFSIADHLDIIELTNSIVETSERLNINVNRAGISDFFALYGIPAEIDGVKYKSLLDDESINTSIVDEMKFAREVFGVNTSADDTIVDSRFLDGLNIKRKSLKWAVKNAPKVFNAKLLSMIDEKPAEIARKVQVKNVI